MRKASISLLFILAMILIQIQASAQCAMCRAVIDSEISEAGSQVSSGINNGILYLMVFPYLLIFSFLAYVFKNRLKQMLADLF